MNGDVSESSEMQVSEMQVSEACSAHLQKPVVQKCTHTHTHTHKHTHTQQEVEEGGQRMAKPTVEEKVDCFRTLTCENVSPGLPVRQTQDPTSAPLTMKCPPALTRQTLMPEAHFTRDAPREGGGDTRGQGGGENLPQSSTPSSNPPLFEPPPMTPRDRAASASCTAVGAAGAGADTDAGSRGAVRGTSAGRTDEATLEWRLSNYYQVFAPYLVDRAPRYPPQANSKP